MNEARKALRKHLLEQAGNLEHIMARAEVAHKHNEHQLMLISQSEMLMEDLGFVAGQELRDSFSLRVRLDFTELKNELGEAFEIRLLSMKMYPDYTIMATIEFRSIFRRDENMKAPRIERVIPVEMLEEMRIKT